MLSNPSIYPSFTHTADMLYGTRRSKTLAVQLSEAIARENLCKRRLQAAQKLPKQLRARVAAMENQIKTIKLKLQESHSEHEATQARLTAQIASKTSLIEQLRLRLKQLASEKSHINSDNSRKTNSTAQENPGIERKQEVRAAHSSLEETSDELQRAQDNARKTKKKLEHTKRDLRTAKKEIQKLKAKVRHLNGQLSDATRRRKAAEKTSQALAARSAKQKAKLSTLARELKEKDAALRQADGAIMSGSTSAAYLPPASLYQGLTDGTSSLEGGEGSCRRKKEKRTTTTSPVDTITRGGGGEGGGEGRGGEDRLYDVLVTLPPKLSLEIETQQPSRTDDDDDGDDGDDGDDVIDGDPDDDAAHCSKQKLHAQAQLLNYFEAERQQTDHVSAMTEWGKEAATMARRAALLALQGIGHVVEAFPRLLEQHINTRRAQRQVGR
eukprot:jgi/Bigna1/144793/aug1.91_g19501